MKKTILILLFALAAYGAATAATLPFRSGELLSAELSTAKLGIANEDPLAFPLSFDRRIYAELVVKIAPGRGISIHDYALEAFGVAYPCIALRAGDNAFNADVWEVRRANANEKYTLLFVLDATLVGLTPEQTLTLQAQFPPKDRADQPVPFTNLKNRSFTPPRSIPNSGNMKAARK